MRSRYSQITVFVLNAISDVFTNVTYTVIICIKSSKERSLPYYIIHVEYRASRTDRSDYSLKRRAMKHFLNSLRCSERQSASFMLKSDVVALGEQV